MKPAAAVPPVDRALLDLVAQVLPVWARHLDHSRQQTEAAVADMLAAFAELAPRLDAATSGAQVERMYKGLQYQDRLSQMVTLLHDDMQRLQQALARPQAPLDPEQWLARLQAGYVMAEQHQLHVGATSVAVGTDADDTTFF